MRFSPEMFTKKAVLAAAIAVGVSLASPPSANAQFRERSQNWRNDALAQGQQRRPGGANRGGPNGGGPRGQNRPQRDGAQRGQRPGFDRPGDRPPGGDRPGGGPPGARPGGPGGEGGPKRDGERSWKDVPQDRRQELLNFVEEHFPRLWVEMGALREKNADGFQKRMRRILPDIVHMMRVYQHDPQMGSLMIRERQLDMRIRHAAHQFHGSPDPNEKEKLRTEIRELVGKAFDVQLQRRALEITSLESRLAELKDRLTGQEDVREEMIQQRAKHLLENKPPRMRGGKRPGGNDADGLDRPPPPGEHPDDAP